MADRWKQEKWAQAEDFWYSGKTTRRQIEDVTAMLDPVPCVGSILNRYQGGFGDAYGYGYYGDDYTKYYR